MGTSHYTPEEMAEGLDLALRSFTTPQDETLLNWVLSIKKNNTVPSDKIPLELVQAIGELAKWYRLATDPDDVHAALCDMFVWGYLWQKEEGRD